MNDDRLDYLFRVARTDKPDTASAEYDSWQESVARKGRGNHGMHGYGVWYLYLP
jgi:hypothetical protein